jgi:hypothetical protein
MAFLSTLAGLALLMTIIVAVGVLCYAILSLLQHLEVAAVTSRPSSTPLRRPPRH